MPRDASDYDLERIVQDAYIAPQTRILMSFAMRGGGHLFMTTLRNELMNTLNFYSSNSVYVDSVAMRDAKTIEYGWVPDREDMPNYEDTTFIRAVKYKNRGQEEKYMIMQALNSQWGGSYETRMAEADVMFIWLTEEFKESKYCMKEWGWYQEECKKRQAENRPALTGVVVGVGYSKEETTQFATDPATGEQLAHVLTVRKTPPPAGHATSIAGPDDSWYLDQYDLRKVFWWTTVFLGWSDVEKQGGRVR